jgi:hypothetical protein
MLVVEVELKLLEDSGTHFEAKYWCEYLTLVDTLFTYIKARNLDREKVPFNIINNNIFQ